MKKKLFIDRSICIGCRYCEAACSLVHSHEHEVNPRQARITVHLNIIAGIFAPVVCKHCTKPPCVEVCRFDAMPIDPLLGIPTINPEKCTGCMACLEVCPFGAILFDSKQGVAIMCDLCGGDPKCVKFCPVLAHVGYAALAYVSSEEWSKRRARVASTEEATTS